MLIRNFFISILGFAFLMCGVVGISTLSLISATDSYAQTPKYLPEDDASTHDLKDPDLKNDKKNKRKKIHKNIKPKKNKTKEKDKVKTKNTKEKRNLTPYRKRNLKEKYIKKSIKKRHSKKHSKKKIKKHKTKKNKKTCKKKRKLKPKHWIPGLFIGSDIPGKVKVKKGKEILFSVIVRSNIGRYADITFFLKKELTIKDKEKKNKKTKDKIKIWELKKFRLLAGYGQVQFQWNTKDIKGNELETGKYIVICKAKIYDKKGKYLATIEKRRWGKKYKNKYRLEITN